MSLFVRLVFGFNLLNLFLPDGRLEPVQVETNEVGEVETLEDDAEIDTGAPRHDLTDDMPGGLGGATGLPRQDLMDLEEGWPRRWRNPSGT